MRRISICLLSLLLLGSSIQSAQAFCGFYVAKADTKLFNRASQVAIVRHDDKTVLTMANDFRGDLKEFAIVIPVPTFITREQIHVTDKKLLDHLDAYSAPRLVEYFDPDPCLYVVREMEKNAAGPGLRMAAGDAARARSLGVIIEAQYTVGEYDIVILSATQSSGLLTFLREEGYRLPKGAGPILGSYMKQGMRFFLARVNLEEQAKLGYSYLRPLQVAYESPKFMLPIRLGTLNADGPQELFAYVLTRKGRVETTNYRTIKLPTGMDLPVFIKDEFGDFYRDMFSRQVKEEDMRVVFLEYAWNMSWCDPCAADPLSNDELRELGVFWLDDAGSFRGGPQQVYITRLHVRYDKDHFPEDLIFQETADTGNFQGRYVLRHPWKGNDNCPQAQQYRESMRRRWDQEARNLASLTGWDINRIRDKMRANGSWFDRPIEDEPWWKRIWRR